MEAALAKRCPALISSCCASLVRSDEYLPQQIHSGHRSISLSLVYPSLPRACAPQCYPSAQTPSCTHATCSSSVNDCQNSQFAQQRVRLTKWPVADGRRMASISFRRSQTCKQQQCRDRLGLGPTTKNEQGGATPTGTFAIISRGAAPCWASGRTTTSGATTTF